MGGGLEEGKETMLNQEGSYAEERNMNTLPTLPELEGTRKGSRNHDF